MAGGGAGALLLRAAALGGLTAAAWLLSGTSASASPEEPPPVEIAIETPNLLEEAPQLLDDPVAWTQSLTASLIDRHQPARHHKPPVLTQPREPDPEEPAEQDEGPVVDFSGGSHSNTRSGTVSNEAPPEVIQAKAEIRAAKKAAKAAAELPAPPPPAPPVVVAVKKAAPQPLPVLNIAKTEPAPANDYNWTAPGQDAPLPAPQQAPVVATASASSGHTDNSGGTRGVLAVLTSHNALFPPSTWSVEERSDGRSPGSLPGLPSTSPD
ncbi:hypothetical protein ACIA8G_24505 [Lentzea sp. NPDC051213]|uniref:hypothetical protein n=1 Tax=Lentzea sp. NPDC051213 TaxID=3364126 RepID=UPI0037B40AB6